MPFELTSPILCSELLVRLYYIGIEEGMATSPVFLPGESSWTAEPGQSTVHGVPEGRPQLSSKAQARLLSV